MPTGCESTSRVIILAGANLCHNLERQSVLDTPLLLASAVARLLPLVILEGEENDLVTASVTDRLDGRSLVLRAGNGLAVGVTTAGPASLQVDNLVAPANVLENVELALSELAGIRGRGVGVEVSVDVGTSDTNVRAEGRLHLRLLPDVKGLSSGPVTGVARAARLNVNNELLELLNRADAALDALVTNNEELNHGPLGPGNNVVDLLLDVGGVDAAASALDKDTNDHGHAILLASRGNGLVGVTVAGVDADSGEAVGLELRNILLNLAGGLASTIARAVGGVSDGPHVGRTSHVTKSSLGLGLLRLGLHGLRLLRLGLLRLGLGLRSGLLGLRSRSRNARAGKRAVVDGAGLGDGDGGVRSSVGTGEVAGRSRVDNDGLLGNSGGVGTNSVGTSAGADVGGHDDGAGRLVVVSGDGSDRASHNGGSLDDGGVATDGVGARRNLGGGSAADSGGLVNSDGLGGDGVGARRRASDGVRSRQNGSAAAQSGGRDGASLGAGAVAGGGDRGGGNDY